MEAQNQAGIFEIILKKLFLEKKMFKKCLLPPSDIVPSSPKLKNPYASNCYPTAFSLSQPLVKNWRKTNFQKEIKTLWEEVAAANFAPLVCCPA